jgi:hypothetical protein
MRIALVIGVCMLSSGGWAQTRVEDTKIAWITVQAADAAAVMAVRWLGGTGAPMLVASARREGRGGPMDSTLVFSSGPALRGEMLAAAQSLPSQPDWDVAVGASGAPVFVYTDAGGAVNALLLQDARDVLPVTTGKPFESFQRPRFVKHAAGRPLIAIQNEKSAIFFMTPGIEDGPYRTLLDCDTALALARVDRYDLLYKMEKAGPPRGNLLAPGSLHAVELDSEFRTLGMATEPLPGAVVYQYDADMADVGTVILATTAIGTMLKVGHVARTFTELLPQEMTSPSVLVARGRIYAAAIERAGTSSARIVMAELPL